MEPDWSTCKGLRALEIHTGGGPRQLTLEHEARLVPESVERKAVVSEVARRQEFSPQYLVPGRATARRGELVLPADGDPKFARIVVSDPAPAATRGAGLEVRIRPALIWVGRGSDFNLLRDVVQALRAAA